MSGWAKITILISLSAVTALCALVLIPRVDRMQPVDAVVALGGAEGERFDLGYRIAKGQDVPLVLSASAVADGERMGLVCGREVICIQPMPYSTAGEARAVASIAESQGWERIGVATTAYHANRARILFRQCVAGEVSTYGAEARRGGSKLLYRRLREIPATVAALTAGRAC